MGSEPKITAKSSWADLIDESVRTSDDEDIGEVEAVNRDFLVIKRGVINVHHYYIPVGKVEGWDGKDVWLKITEDDVERNYERERMPDIGSYLVSGLRDVNKEKYDLSYFRIIMPSIPPKYREEKAFVASKEPTAEGEAQIRYRCDLCNETFRSQDELSTHVSSNH